MDPSTKMRSKLLGYIFYMTTDLLRIVYNFRSLLNSSNASWSFYSTKRLLCESDLSFVVCIEQIIRMVDDALGSLHSSNAGFYFIDTLIIC